ncbi:hypothetical protein KIL84_019044 [Mauremys mutica]|uniref:Uncharacterized protein n=1 Tax=Mauremys mutica TaxID=74926 RepID=A0A9D3XW73_9SAUR|nr:hypothetical protein KIL84_019044 [Mauremys mutica]
MWEGPSRERALGLGRSWMEPLRQASSGREPTLKLTGLELPMKLVPRQGRRVDAILGAVCSVKDEAGLWPIRTTYYKCLSRSLQARLAESSIFLKEPCKLLQFLPLPSEVHTSPVHPGQLYSSGFHCPALYRGSDAM